MYDKLLGIFGVVFTFGVAILVHEFGHFVAAKLAGIGVDTFSIGFGRKIFKLQWRGTIYAIGWIPFGGYVQLKGAVPEEIEKMIKEESGHSGADSSVVSSDNLELKSEKTKQGVEQPVTIAAEVKSTSAPSESTTDKAKKKQSLAEIVFEDTSALRNRGAFTKICVFTSGVFFNYLTALIILTLIFTVGFYRDADFKPILSKVPKDSFFKNFDLREGDKIIKVENEPVKTWSDSIYALFLIYKQHKNQKPSLEIERQGKIFSIKLPLFADENYTSGSLGSLSKSIPTIVGDVDKNSPAFLAGIKPGDKIEEINNHLVKSWDEITEILKSSDSKEIHFKVKRGEKSISPLLNPGLKSFPQKQDIKKSKEENPVNRGIYSKFLFDLQPHIPPYVGDTFFNKPAEIAGIKAGDFITAIDGVKMNSWWDFVDEIQKGRDKTLVFTIKRGGKIFDAEVKPKVQAENPAKVEIGIISGNPDQEFVKETFFTSLRESVPRTFGYVKLIVEKTAEIFGTLNVKLIQENVGGPISIGIFSYKIAQKKLSDYFFFFVIFNLMLFIMNILPIPVMDGGHILFTLIEGVIRRPIPPKLMLKVNVVFVFLLISLTILVTFNDIIMNFWRFGFGGG